MLQAAGDGNDIFLRSCRSEPVERTPVWFMRQAGRSQRSYRRLRETRTLMDIVHDPRVAAKVTMAPVEELGVDAAILFSDIMVPLGPMGVDFEIREGTGPVVADPIRTAAQVAGLRELDPLRDVPHVLETVERAGADLTVPVIGFAGAPFTLACYLVEGGPSRTYTEVKRLMWGQPDVFTALMAHLTRSMQAYLLAQVAAGARAVQVFDSWVGALSPEDYRLRIAPHMAGLFASLGAVPTLSFGVGTAGLLEAIARTGPSVVGLDWRVDLAVARQRLGPHRPVQGNLDPAVMLAPWPIVAGAAGVVLAQNAARRGHIFNLGHGVLPETDPAQLRRLVALVHEQTADQAPAAQAEGGT